jgi:hypothetical protein
MLRRLAMALLVVCPPVFAQDGASFRGAPTEAQGTPNYGAALAGPFYDEVAAGLQKLFRSARSFLPGGFRRHRHLRFDRWKSLRHSMSG